MPIKNQIQTKKLGYLCITGQEKKNRDHLKNILCELTNFEEKKRIEVSKSEFNYTSNYIFDVGKNCLHDLTEMNKKTLVDRFKSDPQMLAIFDKLLSKSGSFQMSKGMKAVSGTTNFIGSIVPLSGGFNTVRWINRCDDALIALEQSLTIEEHLELVEKSENRLKNEVIAMLEDLEFEKERLKEELAEQRKIQAEIGAKRKQELFQQEQQTKKKLEALGIEEKKLQTKEKIEFEKLTEKHKELEKNCSSQEAKSIFLQKKLEDFLDYMKQLESEKKILFLEYERLESNWNLQLKLANSYEIKVSQLKGELRIEKESVDYYKSSGAKHALNWQTKCKELEQKETQITVLNAEKGALKEEIKNQQRKIRLSLLVNVCQGVVDYLPIPKKLRETTKFSIQAGASYALIKELPSYTYEGLIVLLTLGTFFFLRYLKRKVFPNKQVSNIEKALENIVLKQGKEKLSKSAKTNHEKSL